MVPPVYIGPILGRAYDCPSTIAIDYLKHSPASSIRNRRGWVVSIEVVVILLTVA